MKYIFTALLASGILLHGCSGNNTTDKKKERISTAMAATLREAMVKDLTGSETSKTNDIQRYCDCVVDSLQTGFTRQEVMEAEFTNSRKYKKVQDTCLKSTRIK